MKVKVYIIDNYERYMRQGNEISIHWVRGKQYCIREVEMEWGLPVLNDGRIDQQAQPRTFGIYEDYDAALKFIKDMQRLNGGILD